MKTFLKNLFVRKWQYKLFALIAAIVLWFYVVREQNLSIGMNVPVEFSNFPASMKLVNNVKSSVELTLEGRRDIINSMNKKDMKVHIDLKNAEEGKNLYVISSSRISLLPRGIYIKDVSPARINLIFEKKAPPVPVPAATPVLTPGTDVEKKGK